VSRGGGNLEPPVDAEHSEDARDRGPKTLFELA
jgi:hypothetical protein